MTDKAITSWQVPRQEIILVQDSNNRNVRFTFFATDIEEAHKAAVKVFCKQYQLKPKSITTGYLSKTNTYVHILKGIPA